MSLKISQMTEATEIKSGDMSVVVQDGETKQFQLDLLATKVQADEYKTGVETQLADYEQEITDIKNQYDKELYTPTITVTSTSMVKTGQGDTVDYSASVEDGVVKSAILKGQTSVNLIDFNETNGFDLSTGNIFTYNPIYTLEPNITYTFKIFLSNVSNDGTYGMPIAFYGTTKTFIFNEGWNTVTFLPTTSTGTCNIRLYGADINNGATAIIRKIMLLKGDYTSVDIPYFTGMQSVKMPVLMTTGKNLFDGFSNVTEENGEYSLDAVNRINLFTTKLILKANKTVTISCEIKKHSDFVQKPCLIYGNNEILMSQIIGLDWVKQNITITPETDCVLNFGIGTSSNSFGYSLRNIQIEEGSVATSYEPFKSNILTVNEDVTLRSNGSVYDELDLLTGKLTQRIDEDGSVLTQEVVKTVVLNPSGTLASETPYMWKNGSIQLSSDGLVPGLDYAVTTSRVGVIETNMNKTITNEKRIHALEVMLAQSAIAAAADAVSLQSDLEATTMSVDGAQLDTGNTQDDFLYEMILLLIEKDAYDESLFDKVCAFYLYGKLSDEQFTNIYSLLYPECPEEE